MIAVVAAAAACDSGERVPAAPKRPADSNVFAADYVGPAACGACHPDEHARWSGSLHRVMNAKAGDPGAVIGNFDHQRLAYAGGEAHFDRDARGLTMTLAKAGVARTYRVTRTIGHRNLQEYVGVVDGDPRADEVRLPFGWWPRAGGWQPQAAFDPWVDEGKLDVYAPLVEPWAARCPWCHSTYPFEQRIARSDARGVGHGHEQSVTLGGARADGSDGEGRERLDVAAQVTTGISCESCHLGGRAHAAGGPIHLEPRGAQAASGSLPERTFAEERLEASVVNTTCAQCHSGPSPRLPDGTALRNSSEALDLAASPCTNLRCTECHDPHAGDGDDPAGIDKRAIAACTRCHDKLADAGTARAHAGPHAAHASAPAASCLDCHMPRVVMGLDRYVRTHRISSPTDARVIDGGGPNACNLCHLDRPLGWTLASLRDTYDLVVPVRDTSDLDTPAGEQWLASPRPAFRLIAVAAYARAPGLAGAVRASLERGLTDRLAYVRAWTKILLGH